MFISRLVSRFGVKEVSGVCTSVCRVVTGLMHYV